MHACEHGCLTTHTAALRLSDCRVVGHYVKFGGEIRLALIIHEPQGGRAQAPCRRAYTQLFPDGGWQIQRVIPSSTMHPGPSHCTRNNQNSSAYAGNNFSWSCNNLDFCHNIIILFCIGVHFLTTAVHFLTLYQLSAMRKAPPHNLIAQSLLPFYM